MHSFCSRSIFKQFDNHKTHHAALAVQMKTFYGMYTKNFRENDLPCDNWVDFNYFARAQLSSNSLEP